MLRPACLIVLCLASIPAHAGIAVFPAAVELTGREAAQPLVVQQTSAGRVLGNISEGLEFASSDPQVARIEAGRIFPVGNGEATVSVRAGADTATIPVVVKDFGESHAWSFRNHVQSVLTKAGCNMGSCHGATAGKGGFRLSLRGYDPETD
ncbi:MAG TPA: S-layer protein, partial [Planctomycetaceae bacterium]|nr:S-layer protein [Planctomycetaceae bacterium]